jgi:NAD(P)-dependent dehydrogenase (short-subunit alcohol dehydrogenase family)
MTMLLSERSAWLQALWRNAKRWRDLPLGPVTVTYKFKRTWRPREQLQPLSAARAAQLPTSMISRQQSPQSPELHAAYEPNTLAHRVAVIVGVGPGFGEAAAMLLAQKGFQVALVSRSASALNLFAAHLCSQGAKAAAFACDVTDERAVMSVMQNVEQKLGPPELLIYAVQSFHPGTLLSTDAVAFEECWRGNCLGAFIISKETAKIMRRFRRGTILFAGATSGTIGRKGYVNLAIGKFGLRALAQVMARELAPEGIHVAHVVIDGDISEGGDTAEGPLIEAHELAALFWTLHQQPRSCWSSEVDVRPANEEFWEHC